MDLSNMIHLYEQNAIPVEIFQYRADYKIEAILKGEDGQELLVLVTELIANDYSARFIACYGCTRYYKHNDELLFYERQTEILKELSAVNRL